MKTQIMTGEAIALAISILCCSCNKYETDIQTVTDTPEYCSLTVDMNAGATKAVGQTSSAEDAVNNITVFVFRTDEGAKLDASSYELSATSVTLKCTTGPKKIYVLANSPEDFTETVTCESDLLSKSTLLSDNGLDDFFMMGSTYKTISSSEDKVSVQISRLVSSVRLDRVTNLMDAKAYRSDGLFVIDRIYLTNVVGKMILDGTGNPSSLAPEFWLAKNAAEENPLILDSDVNATVNYGESNARAIQHTFYAYPNNCSTDESALWTQRSTMLVIEATLDGEKYYYPVAVGPLESNKQYIVTEFIIRRPGMANPWECVHKEDASFEIEVVPWDTSVTATEDL